MVTIAPMNRMSAILALAVVLSCPAQPALARTPWSPQADLPSRLTIHSSRELKKLSPAHGAMLNEALGNLKIGRYKKALALLDDFLELRPNCSRALKARARVLLTLGYLYWTRALVRQAITDAETFLWQEGLDVEMRDLLALCRQLDKRMKRIESARAARKRKGQRTKQRTRKRARKRTRKHTGT